MNEWNMDKDMQAFSLDSMEMLYWMLAICEDECNTSYMETLILLIIPNKTVPELSQSRNMETRKEDYTY